MKKVKDVITDLIGLAILIGTLVEVYLNEVEWVWHGIAGITVGFVLFMIPDDGIIQYLKSWADKKLKGDEPKTD